LDDKRRSDTTGILAAGRWPGNSPSAPDRRFRFKDDDTPLACSAWKGEARRTASHAALIRRELQRSDIVD
jgi:hypothetical protein